MCRGQGRSSTLVIRHLLAHCCLRQGHSQSHNSSPGTLSYKATCRLAIILSDWIIPVLLLFRTLDAHSALETLLPVLLTSTPPERSPISTRDLRSPIEILVHLDSDSM